MIVVDRTDFIAWSEGLLLERKGQYITALGDQEIHERAQEALDRGEAIALTINGEIVTNMKMIDGSYTEYRV